MHVDRLRAQVKLGCDVASALALLAGHPARCRAEPVRGTEIASGRWRREAFCRLNRGRERARNFPRRSLQSGDHQFDRRELLSETVVQIGADAVTLAFTDRQDFPFEALMFVARRGECFFLRDAVERAFHDGRQCWPTCGTRSSGTKRPIRANRVGELGASKTLECFAGLNESVVRSAG